MILALPGELASKSAGGWASAMNLAGVGEVRSLLIGKGFRAEFARDTGLAEGHVRDSLHIDT